MALMTTVLPVTNAAHSHCRRGLQAGKIPRWNNDADTQRQIPKFSKLHRVRGTTGFEGTWKARQQIFPGRP